MTPLARDTPAAPVRIVHLGLGNFFRAHQAWYTAVAPDHREWGIAAFTGRSRPLADALSAQGGVYTLVVRGAERDDCTVLGAVVEAHPGTDLTTWCALVSRPATAIVTLTVTEAGYRRGRDGGLDPEDPQVRADVAALRDGSGDGVVTVPGRLVAGLAARRAAGAGPIAVVCCDNLPGNGAVVARVVTDLAALIDTDADGHARRVNHPDVVGQGVAHLDAGPEAHPHPSLRADVSPSLQADADPNPGRQGDPNPIRPADVGVAAGADLGADANPHPGADSAGGAPGSGLSAGTAGVVGLVEWIRGNVSFVTTMVDRITPETTPDDVAAVAELTGHADAAPVVTEPFTEWVLQGDFPAGRPVWEAGGARFVTDVGPYEQRKLWLLNGGHSLLAYAGSALGHETVAQAAADPRCRAWLDQWWDEAAPHLPLPVAEVADYRAALLDRWANPRIKHQLAQIAADGSQKIPIRILPVLRLERAAGRDAAGAIRVLAAWIRHLRGAGAPVRDAAAETFTAAAAGEPEQAVRAVLKLLEADDGLTPAVVAEMTALAAFHSRP